MAVFEPCVIGGGVTARKGEDPQPISRHAFNGLAELAPFRVGQARRDLSGLLCNVR